jgi:putative two-component system response regulator
MPHEEALRTIAEGRGSHFDPDIVDAFLSVSGQFQAVAARFRDSEADLARKGDQAESSPGGT